MVRKTSTDRAYFGGVRNSEPYTDNLYRVDIDDVSQLTIDPTNVTVRNNLTASGDVVASGDSYASNFISTGDITVANTLSGSTVVADSMQSYGTVVTETILATRGNVVSYNFTRANLLQSEFGLMTASFDGTNGYTNICIPKSGSVYGFSLYTQDGIVKSGSLSASIILNGENTDLTIAMHTGSASTVTTGYGAYALDPLGTFGISITASADYLCEPDITSCSFIATVLVEL